MEKVGVRAFENLKDKSYLKLEGHIKQSRIVKIKKILIIVTLQREF